MRFRERSPWRNTVRTDIGIPVASRQKRWRSSHPAPRVTTTPMVRGTLTCRERARCRAAPSAGQYCSRSPNRLGNVRNADLNCTPASNANTLTLPAASNVTSRFRSGSRPKTNVTIASSTPCGSRSKRRRPAKQARSLTTRGRRSTTCLRTRRDPDVLRFLCGPQENFARE